MSARMESEVGKFGQLHHMWVPIPGRKSLPENFATHYAYDGQMGGMLRVPDDKYDAFIGWVTADLEKKIPLYLTENRSKVFRMYLDLDFKCPVLPVMEEDPDRMETDYGLKPVPSPLGVIRTIRESFKDFFPECSNRNIFDAIILTAPPAGTKLGVHVVFPLMLIRNDDSQQAMNMHVWALRSLVEKYGPRYGDSGPLFQDVFDSGVYRGNRGLRMPFNRQLIICSSCNGRQPALNTCKNCFRMGKQDTGRVYEFHSRITDGDQTKDHQRVLNMNLHKIKYLLYWATIRTTESVPTSGWFIPDNCPRPLPEVPKSKESLEKVTDPKILDCVQKSIRMVEKYKHVTVNSVEFHPKKTYAIVHVIGEGQYYCQNLQKEHRSRPIYFVIKPDGIRQKCTCKCAETHNRVSGLRCMDYESQAWVLIDPEDDVRWRLFPCLINCQEIGGVATPVTRNVGKWKANSIHQLCVYADPYPRLKPSQAPKNPVKPVNCIFKF